MTSQVSRGPRPGPAAAGGMQKPIGTCCLCIPMGTGMYMCAIYNILYPMFFSISTRMGEGETKVGGTLPRGPYRSILCLNSDPHHPVSEADRNVRSSAAVGIFCLIARTTLGS